MYVEISDAHTTHIPPDSSGTSADSEIFTSHTCTHQHWNHSSLMCAQVTRQVSLLGLIARGQGRKLVNTFLLHIICCIGLCVYLLYKLSIICHPGYNYRTAENFRGTKFSRIYFSRMLARVTRQNSENA